VGRIRLFRLAGLRVEGHLLLLPLLVAVVVVLATSILPAQDEEAVLGPMSYWLMGLGGSVLLFGSLLAHEVSRALIARSRGQVVERVCLLGNPPSDEDDVASDPVAEFLVAATGPATSLSLGGLAWSGAVLLGDAPHLAPLLWFAGVANILIGLAALLPSLPLAGGRMLRALFWGLRGSRLLGTQAACAVSKGFGMVLGGLSLCSLLLQGSSTAAFWGTALGFVLWLQAGVTWRLAKVREGLRDFSVEALVQPLPAALPRQASVEDALTDPDYLLRRVEGGAWLVEYQGRLGGIVTAQQLAAVPPEERASTTVWQCSTKLRWEHLLSPRISAGEALARMHSAGLPLLPVTVDGQVRGMLSRRELRRIVEATLKENPQRRPA
jgi:Zn-dependent protease